jgi:hypothetical protein
MLIMSSCCVAAESDVLAVLHVLLQGQAPKEEGFKAGDPPAQDPKGCC